MPLRWYQRINWFAFFPAVLLAGTLLFCAWAAEYYASVPGPDWMEWVQPVFLVTWPVAFLLFIAEIALKRYVNAAILGVTVLLTGAWIVLAVTGSGTTEIARATMKNGTKILLLQTYNDDFIRPYSVACYSRATDGQWRYVHFSPDDTRWFHGSIRMQEIERYGKMEEMAVVSRWQPILYVIRNEETKTRHTYQAGSIYPELHSSDPPVRNEEMQKELDELWDQGATP